MTDDWDDEYFGRSDEREAERAEPRVVAHIGLPCLNPVELELVMRAETAIMHAGTRRVSFTDIDEDTGEEIILVPTVTDAETEMSDMIYGASDDDIRLARTMGKHGTHERFKQLKEQASCV